jgi:hypothetical protein
MEGFCQILDQAEKSLAWTNTLAYYTSSKVMKQKNTIETRAQQIQLVMYVIYEGL